MGSGMTGSLGAALTKIGRGGRGAGAVRFGPTSTAMACRANPSCSKPVPSAANALELSADKIGKKIIEMSYLQDKLLRLDGSQADLH